MMSERNRSLRSIPRAAVVMFLCAAVLAGQKAVRAQAQVPAEFALAQFLPPEVSGWRKSGEDRVYSRKDVFDYHAGAGELYLAFDLRFVFVREYAKPGAPAIVVEIHQMSSAADAFGLFTQERKGREVRLGQDALYNEGALWFWKGDVFVRIKAEHEDPEAEEAVIRLGGEIDSAIPNTGPKPGIVERLPAGGLESGTVRFFHTAVSLRALYFVSNVNVLNLSPETRAAMARYTMGGKGATLILVEYPSEESAFSAYGRFIEIVLLQRFLADREFPPVKLENGKYAGAVHSGNSLAVVVEADSKGVAEDLLERAFSGS